MTDRRRDGLHPTALPIEELLRRSSVGGDLDPELDDVCTDTEAARFPVTMDISQVPRVTMDESWFFSGQEPPEPTVPKPHRFTISDPMLPDWLQARL